MAYVMALPCHYAAAQPCHYVSPRGNKTFETNNTIIEVTDKGFPEILSWVIIGLGQNARWSEAFDKFQA